MSTAGAEGNCDESHLLDDMRERVAGRGCSPLPLLHPIWRSDGEPYAAGSETTCLGGEADGAAAASAAALASPCKASMGAFRVERGSVSSDSSSEEGAVLGTIPYVAYLWGYSTIKTP